MSIAYASDLYAWANEQAYYLSQRVFDQVDIKHLTEELETMGNSELSELESRLELLIMHLLKWQYQPNRQGRSWLLTIKEQRTRIEKRLKRSPSLKSKLNNEEFLQDIWELAVLSAARETGLDENSFPATPIWTLAEILNPQFLP
ncbi:DUF29 domain-containing protein [Muribacter muris]|uniref:DUF29 domain-containing protein n=1 Tax=Muribacter muris TaxID=67855 RepID=A0A4Y9JPT5_9PAST|nr:DUF29 domain-containing protein [Muribacter muris]MBF0786131.1 DUF29 domain-containing protein [Muribacter muris]MBF0827348.1 DUF29 domain-containing protein [Muribacter muris]TFV07804.1 DUF29 domain-containing protein [Muribacter muris]